ncbi:hypothetical protein JDV02_003109 [Purpureocillium takamizusanense]|uniref:Uncharacterized protein n=1 Tax=Purpureocillium takamizusanense TaxID=2060973 RepID=A0A9Q8QBS1_9HYPO|nr:uncharacterized protein JDV02_003109 [Purpureocillium takamizusanense]UNI16695.1 hypothetical protein JDV02_003109 [Purpureocillium takamizusanense]
MESNEDPTLQVNVGLSTQSSPAFPLLPGGLLPYDGSWHVWETAYKAACRRIDELLAEVAYLHMELASLEARNLGLTRENQRVNLILKHLVCSGFQSLETRSHCLGAMGVRHTFDQQRYV